MATPFTTPQLPLNISVAPFPEGFQGDLDEHAQQLVALMAAYVDGNFITGIVLPPGSTLPDTDLGIIFMDGIWYWWNPVTGQYEPQSAAVKAAKNYAKNPVYQVQQAGASFNPPPGISNVFDMSLARATLGGVLSVSVIAGPPAGPLNDAIPSAIRYTAGPSLVPSPGVTDLYAHEHLIEGADIAMLQGQPTSLSFWASTTTPGNYSVYITNTGRDHSYVVNFQVATPNAWTYVTVPSIPPFPTTGSWLYGEGNTGIYIGFPMLVGTQWQTANLGQWLPAFMAGSAKNINMLTVVNNQLAITGIKFEASSACTYLAVPAFEDDLEELMRYYFTTFLYQSGTSGTPINLIANQSGNWACAYVFPRRMARAPMVVPYSYQTNAAGLITDISTNPSYDIPVASLPATRRGIAGTGASTINTTGNLNSTATVTGIPSTAGISTGASVTGLGIPAGTVVVSIVSATSVGLSKVATATATGVALTFNNFSTFATTGTTNAISTTGTTTSVSTTGTTNSFATTGTTNSTTSITAIPSTTLLSVGMPISGSGIPAGATVASITSSTAITISAAATASATGVALTFGTNSITAIPSTAALAAGMPISGSGIPAGSTIATIVSGTAITISAFLTVFASGVALTIGSNSITAIPSTAALVAGMPISGSGIPAGSTIASIVSGSAITISSFLTAFASGVALTIGSNSITAIPSTAQMAVGMPISGAGVPPGSTITVVNSSSQITISNFLTSYATGVAFTVGLFNKGDLFWALIIADARLS